MFEVLFEAPLPTGPLRGGRLPGELGERYAGPLGIAIRPDRPAIVANFVESLDGLVALEPPHTSSSRISGSSEPDRFVMALLRSLVDVVLIGAGTLREAGVHEWTPRGIAPAWAGAAAGWRRELGLAPQPATVVVSARGDVPLDHHGLTRPDVPAVIVTTPDGAENLHRRVRAGSRDAPAIRIEVARGGEALEPVAEPGGGEALEPGAGLDGPQAAAARPKGGTHHPPGVSTAAIVAVLERLRARVVLCEGGPHLMGQLLAADAVDELFITLAPQLLGRGEGTNRFGMVEGQAFVPGDAPWAQLVSVRRSGSHLFLRYALDETRGASRHPAPESDGV